MVKRLQDDNLKIMDHFEWATITLYTSFANLASRNDSLSFSRATINIYTSAANLASRNDSILFNGQQSLSLH